MSGITRVVRVEKNGVGPFQGLVWRDNKLYKMVYKHLAKGSHVSCTVEANGFRGLEGYLFGCGSEDELYEYFGDEAMDYMLMYGFEIKYYEVDESRIVYGRGELAFLPLPSTHSYPLVPSMEGDRYAYFETA